MHDSKTAQDAFTSPMFYVYVASIVLVNMLFSVVPMIQSPIGMVSPVAVLVGSIFVLRDYAQRQSGHYILLAMVIGVIISYIMADPYVAMASALAFAASELIDYIVYSVTKKPFYQRVAYSSFVSAPTDTLIFLLVISAFTPGTFFLMVAAKLIAAAVIWKLRVE